jgi:hypothetical protein
MHYNFSTVCMDGSTSAISACGWGFPNYMKPSHFNFRLNSWLQWPRGLRHIPSPSARLLESWVSISLDAWMSMCVYSACVVLCVGRLATSWSPIQGVLHTMYRTKKLKMRPRPNKWAEETLIVTVMAIMTICMFVASCCVWNMRRFFAFINF